MLAELNIKNKKMIFLSFNISVAERQVLSGKIRFFDVLIPGFETLSFHPKKKCIILC